MKFTNKDIADYYDQTMVHYKKWWKLDEVLAVHYGIWDTKTKNFKEALQNTNQFLMESADIQKNARVLDAGCGVGGSAFFLAQNKNARVTGITLSEKQIQFANQKKNELNLSGQVDFRLEDYTKTTFRQDTFDLVWAIESITSAPDKKKFAAEAFRILKPGGKLIVADYFKPEKNIVDKKNWLKKWQECWSLADYLSTKEYISNFASEGLRIKKQGNITANIFPSSKIMYRAYLMGAIPSIIYNTFNNTSRFAKTHYKSGKYQYKALKSGLWEYWVLVFEKDMTNNNTSINELQLSEPLKLQTPDPD